MSEFNTASNEAAPGGAGGTPAPAVTALHERPGWIALIVGVMMFLTALLSGSILYRLSQNAVESEVRSNLMRTARTAGTIIDGDLHRTFVSRDQEKSPEYLRAIMPLEEMRRAGGDIRFIYTCVLISNQVYFVLDPTPEGDADRDGVDDKSHILQPYEEASDELVQALKSGQAGANSEPYTDAWGTFVSGFAPFHDSDGRMVGVVAVDLNAKAYAERLAGMRTSAWAGVGVAFLLSLAAGRAIHRLQRRLEDYRRRVQSLNARLEQRVIERTAQLETSRRKLEDEVVERRKAEAEANVAREAAETASRAKSQFLANMSHELRTPMNGIIGYTNFLADTSLSDEQREFANTIRICGESLLNIINDVLDFSRIEAGKMSVENTAFNLRQVAAQAVELLAPTAEEKGLQLAFCSSPGLNAQVTGDPNRARQVVINLLGNAIKFTEHGHVAVCLEADPDRPGWLRCLVQDTGIGIPPDKHSLLFEHFSQVDASNTRKFGGTGLGLAISKRLTELMGGTMGLVSAADQGSTFWFALPPAAVPEEAAPRKLPAGLEGARVLVVDRSEVTCRSLGQHLAHAGIEHSFAHGPGEAIQRLSAAALEERPFQIVLIDLLEPGMTGTELVRRIEVMPSLRHTALVMLVSGSRRAEAAHFAAAGCAASLFKPVVHPARLIETLGVAWREHLVAAGKADLLPPPPAPLVPTSTPAVSPVAPTWRVLLVEDNGVNRGLAKTLLERLGCEVDVAINGREGVLKSAINAYDVIFMDCQMPQMDGFEAVNAIRQREGGVRRTPIVAVTANALTGDRERCLASGMDDYIAKPIAPEDLRRACFRWAKSAHTHVMKAVQETDPGRDI